MTPHCPLMQSADAVAVGAAASPVDTSRKGPDCRTDYPGPGGDGGSVLHLLVVLLRQDQHRRPGNAHRIRRERNSSCAS